MRLSDGRTGDPVALRLHADDLGVRVLGDLPDQRLAVRLGHPVARLDLLVGRDDRVEVVLEVAVPRRQRHCRRPDQGLLGAVDLLKERGEIVAVHPLSVTATDRLSKKVSQASSQLPATFERVRDAGNALEERLTSPGSSRRVTP